VDLADLPEGTYPDGFRMSSKGKLIPENYDTDSHSAKRNRWVNNATGELLTDPELDSESSWYQFQQRFNSAKKAIEDATTDGSDHSDDEERNHFAPMGDVVSDPRAVQVFLAGVNNSKKRASDDEDGPGEMVPGPVDRAHFPVAAQREQQNKLARIEAARLEPPADPESEDDEDAVPGTPPHANAYTVPGGSIVPHRQSAADGPTWAQREADPNYVAASPPLLPASPAPFPMVHVPESPLATLGTGAAAA
jgi:hypothetical protein